MKLLKGTVTLTDGCTVYGEQEYQRNYMICAGDSSKKSSYSVLLSR